jgi:hypothetical protein
MIMNFEHIATRTPYNCDMHLFDRILFSLGFEDYIITKIMNRYEITHYDFDYLGVTTPTYISRRRRTNG